MAERFKLISPFAPAGDQPGAIDALADGVRSGKKHNLLLGVTGAGKTFVIASVIEKLQKPALIISPNKILAAQLYAEFKKFFPENAVEYFISYYDYYQPEAYIPRTDTFIEKDSAVNEHIDRLRLKATSSLMSRRDVIVVASVSCIYNLGSPEDYKKFSVLVEKGASKGIGDLLRELVAVQYARNDFEPSRGHFRVKGDIVDVFPAYLETGVRIEFFGDIIESVSEINPLTSERLRPLEKIYIYPAKHFLTEPQKILDAVSVIEAELSVRVKYLESIGKLVEAQRIAQRTRYDMEMLKETGFCHGVENYSRHLSGRPSGARPECLMDYFGEDFLVVIDESHLTVPQIRGMHEGDRARKTTLVDFGFRLPSALDNRPLRFDEFESMVKTALYASATPGEYEISRSGSPAELVIRPTGLVDPDVEIRPSERQVMDVSSEIEKLSPRGRIIVNTLTKKTAEDFAAWLDEKKIRAKYLHSGIPALDRIAIIKDFRLGKFDVLVGVNLLREGLDMPEVLLVAVFDADKEGFLRSERTLIQIAGRAARNLEGRIILYASSVTDSMRRALDEMSRRRVKQLEHNRVHGITPRTIIKAVDDLEEFERIARRESLAVVVGESAAEYMSGDKLPSYIAQLEEEMLRAADQLDFELAAALRDKIAELKEMSAAAALPKNSAPRRRKK
ncbi:MAG: excinuclease ABC subunit B [Elusimicrobia bacterium HGW-Elusimicrobia-1]|nr:MAG: excinuclease ABC subunit B [Elusimicrobia bacterium HGW-Elusimicrobia-1]